MSHPSLKEQLQAVAYAIVRFCRKRAKIKKEAFSGY